MKKYCSSCDDTRETRIIQKLETYPVKGHDITVSANVRICADCQKEIWDSELDDDNLRRAYKKYREERNLLTPEQIKSIRSQYGVSQTTFARILGLGEKTITRYENGSIQDEAPNNLILLVENPDNFKKLCVKSCNILTIEESEHLNIDFPVLPPYQLRKTKSPYQYRRFCFNDAAGNDSRTA